MSHRLFCLVWLQILVFALSAYGQDSAATSSELQSEFKRPEFKPEARVAVTQGLEFLKGKQHKKAINTFTAAARMHPDNGQLRYLLGFAYAKDNQLGPAWLQFRKAVLFNPAYAPSVREFIGLWTAFHDKGVLSIGRPKQQVAEMLGQPDAKQGNPPQEIWQYGFMRLQFRDDRLFSIIDPRGLDAETAKPADVLTIEFDDKTRWQLGNRAIDRLQSVTEYVPKQQSVRDWKELYTVQRLYNLKGQMTPKKMMENIEKTLKKDNSKTNFIVLSDSEHDVLFHWNRKGSKQHSPEHEIVRLVMGERDIHRLAYTRKVTQIPRAEAQLWLSLLQQATLTPAAQVARATN